MPLDPALAQLLAGLAADEAVVRPTDTDVAGARRSHERDTRRFTPPEQRDAVARVTDAGVPGPARPIRLRIYPPKSTAAEMATILWFHGGGWTTGSLETADIAARALCSETPAVVVSVEY